MFGSLFKLENKGKEKVQKLVENKNPLLPRTMKLFWISWLKKKEIEKQTGLLAEIINLNVVAEEE